MKKNIILICILCAVIIVISIFNNLILSNVEKEIIDGLNGFEISNKANDKVVNFIMEYQQENYINGEDYYILCDNVSKFNEYCQKSKEIEKLLEMDPFIVVENLDIYDEGYEDVSIYYNFLEGEVFKNNEYIEEIDNKYCIKYKYLNFENTEFMEIKNGHFTSTILKKDINKITVDEAQENIYIKKVGSEGGIFGKTYYYYNENTHKEFAIRVEVMFGIVKSVERV